MLPHTRLMIQPILVRTFTNKTWTSTKLHNNLDHHHPGDKQRRSQTTEEALTKAN